RAAPSVVRSAPGRAPCPHPPSPEPAQRRGPIRQSRTSCTWLLLEDLILNREPTPPNGQRWKARGSAEPNQSPQLYLSASRETTAPRFLYTKIDDATLLAPDITSRCGCLRPRLCRC